MAYGITKVINASSHTEVLVGSGNTQYQSLRILNPNDGVLYAAKNRDCLGTDFGSWEWKIPSQSYGIVPGPFQTIGLYYLDQSGSGRPGEFVMYPSLGTVDDPFFVSIGRALAASQTSLDIAQGSQPANPGTGLSRLWSDGSGNLYVLTSDGVNRTLLSSSNYGSFAIAGDVRGTISNVILSMRNGSAMYGHYVSGTEDYVMVVAGDNNLYIHSLGTAMYFRRDNNTDFANLSTIGLNILSAANSPGAYIAVPQRIGPQICLYDAGGGNLYGLGINSNELTFITGGTTFGFRGANNSGARVVTIDTSGNMTCNGDITGRYLHTSDGSNGIVYSDAGALYFRSAAGACYVQNNAGAWANLQAANVAFSGGGQWGGTAHGPISNVAEGSVTLGGGASRLYMHPNETVGLGMDYPNMTIFGFPNGTSAYQFNILGQACGIRVGRNNVELQVITHFYAAGSEYVVLDSSATSYTTRSAAKYKANIAPISDADCLSRILNPKVQPISFDVDYNDAQKEAHGTRPPGGNIPNPSRIGFTAEQMHEVVPECIAYHTDDGSPDGIAYAELTALLWGAIREIDRRLTTINA